MKNIKRMTGIVLAVIMMISLTACGGGSTPTGKDSDGSGNVSEAELALVTDVGTIDDKSFNQGSWEGVEAYGKDNDISTAYYKPAEKSDDAYLSAIDLAVKGGAKVIVCPGYLFEIPVHNAQAKYPDVNFILLDGEPKDASENVDIADNTVAIYYAEEEAGFLAGYAAVKEGYTKLGFMGGLAVPPVIRYGYGFVQGAEYAAKEMGVSDIDVKYTYVGNFEASPENMAKASSWYNEGVELIFSCGGPVGNSVMKAAETADTKVIGVDVDQYSESDTVITSAMKSLAHSVYLMLEDYYKDEFKGGQVITLDASAEGVELPMENSRFENFTQEMYDQIFEVLSSGDIDLKRDNDAEDATGLETEIVKVEVVQ